MRKLLFLFVLILIAAVSCLSAPAASKQPPTAYIDSVSSTCVDVGQPVTFTGHGVDPDGVIAAYNWRSSLDGDLSNSASFKTDSLSPGTHTVWFKVQDNDGEWSNQVLATVVVIPKEAGKPVVASFEANPGQIGRSGSSTLSWNVSGATTVSIDQQLGNVALTGTRVVSPSKTMTYTLTAVNQVGTVTATARVIVAEVVPTHVELYSIAAEEGQVRRDNYVSTEPDVGDTKSGTAIQAFLSFDISMIPEHATITSAALDLTAAASYGDPFTKLGLLYVYDCQYQNLTNRDFVIGIPLGAIITIPVFPSQPITFAALAAAVQKQVSAGNTRFQLRLQFQKPQFYNNQADYLSLGDGRSKLIIDYQD